MSAPNSLVDQLNAIHVDKEPGVININKFRTALQRFNPDMNSERIEEFCENPDYITELKLEFHEILRLDHLWMLKSITVLCLNNNIIEKIENINMLVTLKKLNLSFNKIEAMENLEGLVNLEELSLYQNYIKRIENMDTLQSLVIFSIGNNYVQDFTSIAYLRRFKKLQSLCLSGNPITSKPYCREYAAAQIPTLLYFDYIVLHKSFKEESRELFLNEILLLEEKEQDEIKAEKLKAQEEERVAVLRSAFVDGLEGDAMFQTLFAKDKEGQALRLIEGNVQQIYDNFRDDLVQLSQTIFDASMKNLVQRTAAHKEYLYAIDLNRRKSFKKQRETFEAFKEELFDQHFVLKNIIKGSREFDLEPDEAHDFVLHLRERTDESFDGLKKAFLSEAMLLYDHLEDMNQLFERQLGDEVNNFCEIMQESFTQMRDYQIKFLEAITEVATIFLVNSQAATTEINPQLKSIFTSKDTLNNALAASHDVHLLAIDSMEDYIVTGIRGWHADVCCGLHEEEVTRTRKSILEINRIVQMYKEKYYNDLEADLEEAEEIISRFTKSISSRASRRLSTVHFPESNIPEENSIRDVAAELIASDDEFFVNIAEEDYEPLEGRLV